MPVRMRPDIAVSHPPEISVARNVGLHLSAADMSQVDTVPEDDAIGRRHAARRVSDRDAPRRERRIQLVASLQDARH